MKLAQSIDNPTRRIDILFALFTSYSLLQTIALANADLAPRLDIINAVTDLEKREKGLSVIAFQYADRHQFEAALRLVETLKNLTEKSNVLIGIAIRHADSEQPPDTKALNRLQELRRSLQQSKQKR